MLRTSCLMMLLLVSPILKAGTEHINTGKVKYDQQLNEDKIKGAISKALTRRGWKIQDLTQSKIQAYLAKRGFRVDIEFEWHDGLITIKYLNSVGLNYKEKRGDRQIHRNYNKWIANLEHDITSFLFD